MSQPDLARLWEEHTNHEFVTRNTESTLATMVDDAYVNHVPVMTGGFGKTALRAFYSGHFIPSMPPDTTLTPVSRTVGEDQLVDEMIVSFTHTQEMPWMLPGIPPTHRRVEVTVGCDCTIPGRQARARAHLLGPGFRTQANRAAGGSGAAGFRGRDRAQSGGSAIRP